MLELGAVACRVRMRGKAGDSLPRVRGGAGWDGVQAGVPVIQQGRQSCRRVYCGEAPSIVIISWMVVHKASLRSAGLIGSVTAPG